jgi:hypothetical protein
VLDLRSLATERLTADDAWVWVVRQAAEANPEIHLAQPARDVRTVHAGPPGGDPETQGANQVTLTLSDLEQLLRGVAQLSGIKVLQPYPHVAPHHVLLEGAISIHGTPFFWETSVDLRDLKTQDDIATLIRSLLAAFDGAEGQSKKGIE